MGQMRNSRRRAELDDRKQRAAGRGKQRAQQQQQGFATEAPVAGEKRVKGATGRTEGGSSATTSHQSGMANDWVGRSSRRTRK